MISDKVKLVLFYILGPVGCYFFYQSLFVFRHLKTENYPYLSNVYDPKGYLIELILIICSVFISYKLAMKFKTRKTFVTANKNISVVALFSLTVCTLVLICSSVYRVLGTLNFQFLIHNFDAYYFQNTIGLAWMILLCYIIIYTILIDMYFGGVTKLNSLFLFINILIVSVSGGRGLLILFNVTFLTLLIGQSVTWKAFIQASLVSVLVIGSSYFTVTGLRAPPRIDAKSVTSSNVIKLSQKPTDSYEELNYNAAFIIDDVLRGLNKGDFTPGAYAFKDALTVLVPRFIMPNKPISSAETVELYPDVAARGTNITFPLKANLIMHLGRWAFYLDWPVVILAQVMFLLALFRRSVSTRFLGFMFIFSGCAFSLVARGGIFNARLIVQGLCIGIAYAVYYFLRTYSQTTKTSEIDTL